MWRAAARAGILSAEMSPAWRTPGESALLPKQFFHILWIYNSVVTAAAATDGVLGPEVAEIGELAQPRLVKITAEPVPVWAGNPGMANQPLLGRNRRCGPVGEAGPQHLVQFRCHAMPRRVRANI
jgi:hypothetical protein